VREAGDGFGSAAVLADFNDDGCADLAVGAPGENTETGFVVVLYGSISGITVDGAQWFTANSLFGSGSGRPRQAFGSVLASGDLNDDGTADLVVGAPGDSRDRSTVGGSVAVVYGSPAGLGRGHAPALITQQSAGVPGRPEADDRFGAALAVGDFAGDGADDLAVGVPGENRARGVVDVLPVTIEFGPSAYGSQSFRLDTPGVTGTPALESFAMVD
jgi:hypothetical protein